MKFVFQLVFFFLVSGLISAQPFLKNINTPPGTGNTYAVIIGVAKYLDPDIRKLEFANRDAAIFADFLMSKAGGSVPKENIILLTDSAATQAAVYMALTGLAKKPTRTISSFFISPGMATWKM